MGTIQSSIRLYDGISNPVRHAVNAMDSLLQVFEQTQAASGRAVDVANLQKARAEIIQAKTSLQGVEDTIEQAWRQQNNLNNSLREGKTASSGLESKLKSMLGAYAGLQGLRTLRDITDTRTQTQARLSFIVDDGGSVEELNRKILASANRGRAEYQTTADIISKLGMQSGAAFANNNELIGFTEQLNKSFTIAGTDASGIQSTMYNLTQALSSGVLRGQDLNAVFSNAPNIVQNIADYLDVPIGKIRDMAADGEISAGIVKNAMFAAADETNRKFAEMPMTIGQIGTISKNVLMNAFQPAIQMIGQGAQWIYTNWGKVRPVFLGIAAVVGVLVTIWGVYNTITAISNGLRIASIVGSYMMAAAKRAEVSSTVAATAAQMGLNTAMLASPITWIVLGIMLIIGAIFLVVKIVNKATGSTVSAVGIITGILYTLWAFVYNSVILPIWNAVADLVNFFANVWKDPLGAIKVQFGLWAMDIIDRVLTVATAIETLLNKIPGVEVQITSSLTDLRGRIETAVNEQKADMGWTDVVKRKEVLDYTEMATKGYNKGNAIEDKMKNLMDGFGVQDLSNIEDFTAETAQNTKGALEMGEEDLKYLRDIAQRDTVNRYTTASVVVNQNNTNNISGEMDVDGVIGRLNDGMDEAIAIAAEGKHE